MVKAFPTAYGFGADTRGAYGSGTPPVALFVTNLNGSGAGSLRAAATDTRPRVIIFRVGGTIDCLTTIVVTNPYATFAGQTAPGGGICLRNAGTNKFGPFRVEASDIVIRFMKFRGGFVSDPTNLSHSIDFRQLTASNAIEHCIIDHCSISWGTDMNIMTGKGANYITIQRCLIAECLRDASNQGPHNRGLNHRYGGGGGAVENHFTDYANVFSQHEYRTPMLSDVTETEVINNIVYHNLSLGMNVNADDHNVIVSMNCRFENNYFKRFSAQQSHREHQLSDGYGTNTKIYVKGTVGFTRLTETAPEQDANGYPVYVDETDKALKRGDGASVWTQTDRSVVPDSANPPTRVTATQAFTTLVTNYATAPAVGAYRTCNSAGVGIDNPDLTDIRMMNDVKNNTGNFIDREWEVAGAQPAFDARGFPALAAGTAPTDTNNDGIPNGWAGLPVGKTANDTSPTGYSYLENYLNELAGDTAGGASGTVLNHTVANVTRTGKNHTLMRGGLPAVLSHTKTNITRPTRTHTLTYTPAPGRYVLAHANTNRTITGGNHTITRTAAGANLSHSVATLSFTPGTHTMSRLRPPTVLSHDAANLAYGAGSHTMTYTSASVVPPFAIRFLASGADTTNGSSYTTGSFTPTAGSLICVFVDVVDSDDPGAFNISSTLTGGTWTSRWNQKWNTTTSPVGRLRCWTGSGFTGSGTITFSGFPDAVTGARWIVCEVTGQDANPIVQAISHSDDTNNLYEVLPFSSFGTTDHLVISVFVKAGTTALTQSDLEDWLPLDTEVSHATPDRRMWAQYGFNATATTATMDWDGNEQVSASGGLEILHSGATLVFGPTFTLSAPPGRLKTYSATGVLVEERRH
jgi:hypothetical protein